jgi:intracellular sulfur oxidation DsrE/DsrF family protein
MRTLKPLIAAMACLVALCSLPALAADDPSGDKPFAEAHIVLQVGEADPEYQSRVLSIANNLIKHYGGPDFVDIEIVAYGPGISLLFADYPEIARVSSLASNGVRFIGCKNTMDTLERTSGARPEMNPVTIPVQTGVAHLVERAGQGYEVIRP